MTTTYERICADFYDGYSAKQAPNGSWVTAYLDIRGWWCLRWDNEDYWSECAAFDFKAPNCPTPADWAHYIRTDPVIREEVEWCARLVAKLIDSGVTALQEEIEDLEWWDRMLESEDRMREFYNGVCPLPYVYRITSAACNDLDELGMPAPSPKVRHPPASDMAPEEGRELALAGLDVPVDTRSPEEIREAEIDRDDLEEFEFLLSQESWRRDCGGGVLREPYKPSAELVKLRRELRESARAS